jgi:hypothetical protein
LDTASVLVDTVARSWIASAASTMPEGSKREEKQEIGNRSRSAWGHNWIGKRRVEIAVEAICEYIDEVDPQTAASVAPSYIHTVCKY